MAGNIIVITGPSGVGKTTVAKKLLEQQPQLRKVITCTSRPPREQEQDGVDYRFLSETTFERMIDRKELFEWAHVYDRYYGSRKEDVQALLDQQFDVLFVIDVQGAKTIQKEHPEAKIIFLQAESPDILLERIEKRDHGNTQNLEERKQALAREMAFASACTHVVTNIEGRLDETVNEILNILRKKEMEQKIDE